MATITADAVKQLRDKTGAGMMECKAALTEANGNMEDAVTVLRKRGLAQAAKRAGDNPAGRFGFNAATVAKDPDGGFSIVLARDARPGNWLPTDAESRYLFKIEINGK